MQKQKSLFDNMKPPENPYFSGQMYIWASPLSRGSWHVIMFYYYVVLIKIEAKFKKIQIQQKNKNQMFFWHLKTANEDTFHNDGYETGIWKYIYINYWKLAQLFTWVGCAWRLDIPGKVFLLFLHPVEETESQAPLLLSDASAPELNLDYRCLPPAGLNDVSLYCSYSTGIYVMHPCLAMFPLNIYL